MYPIEFRKEIIELFDRGFTTGQIYNRLDGKISRRVIQRWLQESNNIKSAPKTIKRKRKRRGCKRSVRLSDEQRSEMRLRVEVNELSLQQAAVVYDVSITTAYNICRIVSPTIIKAHTPMTEELKRQGDSLPDDVDEPKNMVLNLQCETMILKEVVEILKKDQSVDYLALTNKEKTMIIDAMKEHFSISYLTKKLGISSSSYYYASSANKRSDKYRKVRDVLVYEFEKAKRARGYRYLYQRLKQRADVRSINEKLVRRIMKEEGLEVIYLKKRRRKYNSYAGEITEAPDNLIKRDFHADKPNKLWLTDITEFRLPDTGTKV